MRQQLHFRISPFFFVTAFLIGLLNSETLGHSFIWMIAIFLSIFVHELGHAIAAFSFSQSVYIQFTAFGGATTPIGPKLKLGQEFLMVLMGPLFGFTLFAIAYFIQSKNIFVDPNITVFLNALIFINLIWTIINLFPVLPLDGGQLLRILLESIFGMNGRRYACLFGGGFSLILAFTLLILKLLIPAVFFFLFAFQNFELYRGLRMLSDEDEDDETKMKLKEAMHLSKSHDHQAIEKLENVRSESGKGLVFVIASQELAENYLHSGNHQKALEILEPLEDKLMESGKMLLQKAAFESGKDELVLKIAASSLVNSPDPEMILLALKSAARKQDFEATIGWLQTAKDFEIKNLQQILSTSFFTKLNEDENFKKEVDAILKDERS
jgi:stage IV sporulation protein FB